MDCYFGSIHLPEDRQLDQSVVVSFKIPELGIKFKAPFDAVDANHGDLAALLALLEFIDSNQKYFTRHTYQIYGNNLKVINAVNRRDCLPPEFAPLIAKALGYRDKYRFSLAWAPLRSNPELEELFD
ncbi:MAG TPA: hypothetical protein PLR32_03700 [candidate division Zixibacteria bacterium]|nr:hypothetical protein [candidate division Zixibacteria bacterium]MDD4916307.1 hypothetical protein [candidate division Zixibacteria bacterium]MDM7973433.1 hypothetical protein [candidate division Zixibacteria bacterium]HOD65712.1 hypothetical protein [candidate division Zixibacteria bacterium]HOZ07164.1 hypothetical protein [candidate division Zixibacteria bacterium]